MAQIATIACLFLVVYLFWRDRRDNPQVDAGLWVPLAWMFLAGSRWVSSWLDLRPSFASVDSYSEGSPVDRAVFLALIVAGIYVLARRQINWGALLRENRLLVLYFLYCLASILWADAPFVSFKRWFKDLGNPIMALIILTTPNPREALTLTLRRLSFLLLPASVLFVRYYPELGRVYHFDGSPMYTGIGHQKNDLGLMCLVTGTYFLWQFSLDRERFKSWPRDSRIALYMLSVMLIWLLYMSNSQTSLVCLLIAAGVLLGYRLPCIRRKPSRLVSTIVIGVGTYLLLDAAFDIKERIFALLGRDSTLTNRTELWSLLFNIGTHNAVLGSGFMSFWAGERMAAVWSVMGVGVNQAHSGYIEQFLNLGYVGVAFIAALFVGALINVSSQLKTNAPMATLRLCFLLAALLYNYTEASFYGINNMWVLTLVALIRVPELKAGAQRASFRPFGLRRTMPNPPRGDGRAANHF